MFPVQQNVSQEDVWLSPRTRLGILTQLECVHSDQCEVTVDRKDGQTSDGDINLILDSLHIGGTKEEQAG